MTFKHQKKKKHTHTHTQEHSLLFVDFSMDDLLHEGFHFDVDTYATLMNVRVQIECHGQRNYSGRVYTIDPLTQRFGLK